MQGQVCEKDFPLPASVCVDSSSLESANTSQLLGLLRMRARASEPSSAGGVQAYLPQESAVS